MKDSAFYYKIVIKQAKKYKDLVSKFDSYLIKDILSSKEFYFDKVIYQFKQINNIDKESDLSFALKELNRYYEKIDPNLENLPDETLGPIQEIYTQILAFLAYIDNKTAVRFSQYNDYDDARFITRTNIPQIKWMTELIKYKQSDNLNKLDVYVANTIKFIEDPAHYCNIVSEKHKERITVNLFDLTYDKNLFEERLELFIENAFPKIFELKNTLNKYVLCTEIMYTKELKEIWDIPIPEEKEINYNKEATAISDAAAKKDKLGRQQLVDTIIKCTEDVFNDKEIKDPYTILLNGEWGSGKSSLLNFLRTRLEQIQYTIIDYNAWENQSFKDPWWILINAISKKATAENLKGDFHSHRYWRFKMLYKNQFWAALAIVVFLVSCYFLTKNGGEPTSIPFIISLIGLVGSFIATITGLINNFFIMICQKKN